MFRSLSTRRGFLQAGLGSSLVLGIDRLAPAFLHRAAAAVGGGEDRILVLVQLSGGNDGLNTVIPYRDETYRGRRPQLAFTPEQVVRIDSDTGFHPEMKGMADLLEDGLLSVVQGVGYPNPNRSHFESMDIWHTCLRKDQPRPDGWLGRYLDRHPAPAGGDVPGLHLGGEQQPFALTARQTRVPSVRSLDEFKLQAEGQEAFRRLLHDLSDQRVDRESDLLSFVQSSTSAALVASDRVEAAGREYQSAVSYPENDLARRLRIVAQLIDAGLSTRVYYLELDGFDTHAQQAPAHAVLLRELSSAVTAFMRDVQQQGHGERVAMLCFSEFGRRVAENASAGTDHGAAAPLFVVGGGLAGGLLGERPNLDDLQDGDLKHAVDFRQVYATLLEDWLGAASEPIIGARYETLPLFQPSLQASPAAAT